MLTYVFIYNYQKPLIKVSLRNLINKTNHTGSALVSAVSESP